MKTGSKAKNVFSLGLNLLLLLIVAAAMFVLSFGLKTESVLSIMGIVLYFCVFAALPLVLSICKSSASPWRMRSAAVVLTVLSIVFFIFNGTFYQYGTENYLNGHGSFDAAAASVLPSAKEAAEVENAEFVYWKSISRSEEHMCLKLTAESFNADGINKTEALHIIGDYECRLLSCDSISCAGAVGYNKENGSVVYVFVSSPDLSSIDAWDLIEADFGHCFN